MIVKLGRYHISHIRHRDSVTTHTHTHTHTPHTHTPHTHPSYFVDRQAATVHVMEENDLENVKNIINFEHR